MFTGLKKRPTYNELVHEIETDPHRIHYPDRRATQLRESPYLTQLDGEGMRQMEMFEINKIKNQQKKHMLQEIANNTGQSIAEVQAVQPPQHHGIQHHDMFQDDDPITHEDDYDNPVVHTSGNFFDFDEEGDLLDQSIVGPENLPPHEEEPYVVVPPAPMITPDVPEVAMLHTEPGAASSSSIIGTQTDMIVELASQEEASFKEERKKLKEEITKISKSSIDKDQKIEDLKTASARLFALVESHKQIQGANAQLLKEMDTREKLLEEKDRNLTTLLKAHSEQETKFVAQREIEIRRLEEHEQILQQRIDQHQRQVEQHQRSVEQLLAGPFTPQAQQAIQSQRAIQAQQAIQGGQSSGSMGGQSSGSMQVPQYAIQGGQSSGSMQAPQYEMQPYYMLPSSPQFTPPRRKTRAIEDQPAAAAAEEPSVAGGGYLYGDEKFWRGKNFGGKLITAVELQRQLVLRGLDPKYVNTFLKPSLLDEMIRRPDHNKPRPK
jgi:hypothetical protein